MTRAPVDTYFCMSTVRSNPAPVICHLSAYQGWNHSAVLLSLLIFLLFLSVKECTLCPRGVGMAVCRWGGPNYGLARLHSCSFACTRLFHSIQLVWECSVISLSSPFLVVARSHFFLSYCFITSEPVLSFTKMAGQHKFSFYAVSLQYCINLII